MRAKAWLPMIAVLLATAPAAAQQGSVQVVAASQVTTGDRATLGALAGYQPDFGITWFQPTKTWGTLTFDAHAVRADNDPRLGRALFAVKDLKRGGLTWNLSAGDSAFTPLLADYGFRNLFAPQVTFRGGSIAAASANTSLSITAGRVTVFRDLFAANADALGQSLLVARAGHKISSRVEVVAHASRVRTEDLKGFSYLIESGDDVGAGVRVNATKTLQVIADAGVTSYLRKGATTWERQPSMLLGARWTGPRGWFQVDAHRFSPGNFSVLNNPYNDREGLFAGGEYGLGRVRLYGGWDMFRNDRQADAGLPGTPVNEHTSSRAYGGARMQISSHLFVGARVDRGARVSKPSPYSVGYESDTGSASADWQLTLKHVTAIGRFERRSNVDASGGLSRTRFAEDDLSGQLFFNVTNSTRLYTTLFRTERRNPVNGDSQRFWQASAGTQFQVGHPGVFARGEVIFGRDQEMHSDFLTARTAFSAGVNAQLARRFSLAVDVFANRSPVMMVPANPWMSRTIVRLLYTMPTASVMNASVSSGGTPRTPRGSESIEGMVFVDWNGNGTQDAGEESLPGVRVVLDGDLGALADRSGRFRFEHIEAGTHAVAIDVPTVPATYDLPSATDVNLRLRRNAAGKVAFGMLPLGDIEGVILRDANGNGTIDEADEPLDGAILVLDDGARTEVARRGMFTFSGVRLGAHTVQLLLESLPEDAGIVGEREMKVEVTRDRRTPIAGYLVQMQKRPEIRKVFPRRPDTSGAAPARDGGRIDRAPARSGASRSGNSRSGSAGSRESRSGESKSGESKSPQPSGYGADKTNFRSSK